MIPDIQGKPINPSLRFVTEVAKPHIYHMAEEKHWYALYTKPRWEKKVSRILTERGFESYCPVNKVRRKWSDRIKMIEEPLFKSYVFIRVNEQFQQEVRMVPGIMNFVYWNGKPAVIPEREIIAIKKFLNDFEEVQALPFEVKENARVLITKGVMMDKEAIVQRVLNNKVEVVIESLGYVLVANLDKSSLKPLYD
jgi:transcription antitermination factor NusG